MDERLEKPEPFGKGQFSDEYELREIKPEQLEKCNHKVIGASSSTLENPNFRSNSIAAAIAKNTDNGIKKIFHAVKTMDANRYATKKTIAQGMLDIALLTANASQLKYILQVGKQHEFYTLMLTLICLSIGLQAVVGVLFIIVGGLDINRRRDQFAANIINDVILMGIFVISLTNVIISGFGMEFSNKPREILTGANFAILQGLMFIFVGSCVNINKAQDEKKANVCCNIILASMVLTVVVNVIISGFGLPEE